ncbi:MAG: hypothetical protein FWF12_05235, partial [Betaproteobacteria bacterium]|nr:hypothetical protein [Betaproteobacteria bacterium]
MSSLKTFILLLGAVLSANVMAQATAPAATANSGELIDVVNFFNGGYPYTPAQKNEDIDHISNQIEGISHGQTGNPFMQDDLDKREGEKEATLFYAFAAPATIQSFRVSGVEGGRNRTPRRIEFALSQSPDGNFQTVARFDVPEAYLTASSTKYDFSIPLKQKASGRYARVTLFSTDKYASYRLSRLSAYGRFDQPVELRTDFSGIYHIIGSSGQELPANRDMVNQQKETGYSPFLIFHQKDGQIKGCYVYGSGHGGKAGLEVISEVLGDLAGGIENNVFRFTRTYAKDGSQSQGAMAHVPVSKGIAEAQFPGYLLIMNNAKPGGKEGDNAFRVKLTRVSNIHPPCAVTGQKEKTATEAMQESLEKTGKVQLYGVNFDFDSDVLRPESGAV